MSPEQLLRQTTKRLRHFSAIPAFAPQSSTIDAWISEIEGRIKAHLENPIDPLFPDSRNPYGCVLAETLIMAKHFDQWAKECTIVQDGKTSYCTQIDRMLKIMTTVADWEKVK